MAKKDRAKIGNVLQLPGDGLRQGRLCENGGSEWGSKLLGNVVSTTCGEADGHLSHVSQAVRGEQHTNRTHFCTHFPHPRRPAFVHIKVDPSAHTPSPRSACAGFG
jgi:hypothetical protein